MQEFFNKVLEQAGIFAPKILGSLAVLVIGWWVIGVVTRSVAKALQKSNIESSLRTFLVSMLTIGLKIMLIISAAGILGIETTSFVAIFGAASLAIGLALQGSLSNFAGGALILFFKPFKVGDLIEAQDIKGVVEEIQIFTTVLVSPGGKHIIVPNGQLSNGAITNYSSNGMMCLEIEFDVSDKSDIDDTRMLIKSVIERCPFIHKEKSADIFVAGLDNDAVKFLVRAEVSVAAYWEAFFFMQENVKKEFNKAGIDMPFPQMEVHLRQA